MVRIEWAAKRQVPRRSQLLRGRGQHLLAHTNASGGSLHKTQGSQLQHLLDPVSVTTSFTLSSLTLPESEKWGGKPGGRALEALGRRGKVKELCTPPRMVLPSASKGPSWVGNLTLNQVLSFDDYIGLNFHIYKYAFLENFSCCKIPL